MFVKFGTLTRVKIAARKAAYRASVFNILGKYYYENVTHDRG